MSSPHQLKLKYPLPDKIATELMHGMSSMGAKYFLIDNRAAAWYSSDDDAKTIKEHLTQLVDTFRHTPGACSGACPGA